MTIIAAACYGDGVIFAGDSHPSHMLPTAFEGQRHAVPPARKVFSNKARGFAIGMAGLPDLGGIRPDGRRIEAVNLYGLIWSKLTLTDPDDLGESPVMDCLEIFGAAARCLKSNANPVDLLIGCANYRQEPILLNYSMSPPRWEPAEGVSSSPVAGCGFFKYYVEESGEKLPMTPFSTAHDAKEWVTSVCDWCYNKYSDYCKRPTTYADTKEDVEFPEPVNRVP
jgi:hypothetical protein